MHGSYYGYKCMYVYIYMVLRSSMLGSINVKVCSSASFRHCFNIWPPWFHMSRFRSKHIFLQVEKMRIDEVPF